MSASVFGEGICTLPGNGSFVRMTWQDNIVDLLDSNLRVTESLQMFTGPKEGWGITRNGHTLYVSDGSSQIYTVDAHSFETLGSFTVTMQNGTLVRNLNELEFVNGELWANVFQTNFVLSINPETGIVQRLIDFRSLIETEKKFNKLNNNRMKTWDY